MSRMQQIYKDTVAPELMKKFGYKSVMQVPRLSKITLNMGVGAAVADKKALEGAVSDLTKIAGQKPVTTRARKMSTRCLNKTTMLWTNYSNRGMI